MSRTRLEAGQQLRVSPTSFFQRLAARAGVLACRVKTPINLFRLFHHKVNGCPRLGAARGHAHFIIACLLLTACCGCSPVATTGKTKAASPAIINEDKPRLVLPLKDPRIVVYKRERRLELYSDGKVVRAYRIGLGFSPVADKTKAGDGATPEGDFYVFIKNPKSAFYLSLGVSYPNLEDAERGLRDRLISKAQYNQIARAIKRKAGPPQYTRLGGLIYIHGNGAQSDWTWGCVALENEHIKELYNAVEVGTPVTIKP